MVRFVPGERRAGRRRALVALLVGGFGPSVFGLVGCGSDKPDPVPVPLVAPAPAAAEPMTVTLIASPFINPDPDNRPSPMVVRLYLLGAPDPFGSVAMIDLFDDDKKALGDSLVARQEVIIEPAGVKSVTVALDPKAKVLGVVGGFRRFREATWRTSISLDGQKGPFRIEIGQLGLTLTPLHPSDPVPAAAAPAATPIK